MDGYYILDGRKPVPCNDLIEWSKWYREENRRVNFNESNDIRVSTIFLGIDHGLDEDKPILFETMIFGGEHDEDMWRYKTWEEAEKGHIEACKIAGID